MHSLGEIPESVLTRKFFAFGKQIWRLYRKFGWEFLKNYLIAFSGDYLFELVRMRYEETILCCRDIVEGKIPRPEHLIMYNLFPPVLKMRGDLQQGTSKLIYGESCDMSVISINDFTGECSYVVNAHLEDGIPVDYWLVKGDDELMYRRHMKYGYKFREIPKRLKSLTSAAPRIIDLLKDVRNERTPHWAASDYMVCLAWGTGSTNAVAELSNWENVAQTWMGMNAKIVYGMPDVWFLIYPSPALLSTMRYLGREKYTLRFCGLFTGHHLFLGGLEDGAIRWLEENFPELFEYAFKQGCEEGIPTPRMTLNCVLPNFKKRDIWDSENFERIYPEGKFIHPSDLDLSYQDVIKGVLLNITHEFKNETISARNILARGIARTCRSNLN